MKRILGALLLTAGTWAPAWGLDVPKLTSLEGALGPLMQNTDQKSLEALDTQLAPLVTQAGTSPTDLVRAGIVSHNLSRVVSPKGVTGNAAKAVDRLKGPARGTDAELAAMALPYLGSALALQGAEDWNPAAKVGYVNQGWGVLSEAVDKYGADTFVPRFLRANVGSSLPDFFGKTPDVLADLKALEVWASAHPGRMPDGLRAQVALMEGNSYKKNKNMDQALDAWTRAVALDPQKTGAGKAAAENLDRYGS